MRTQTSRARCTRVSGRAFRHKYIVPIVGLLILGWLYSDAQAVHPPRNNWLKNKQTDGFYHVRTPEDIIDLADPGNAGTHWKVDIRQDNNINMTGVPLVLGGNDLNGGKITGSQIGGVEDNNGNLVAFTGTYDGQGFVISNLAITGNGDNSQDTTDGLFGLVQAEEAQIKNLILVSPTIWGNAACVGGLVGRLNQGTIYRCCIQGFGSVTAAGTNEDVGGLVGRIDSTAVGALPALVSQCFVTCNVFGPANVGGLVGQMSGGFTAVQYSFAADHIVGGGGAAVFPPHLGGLVGVNSLGAISACYADCLVPIVRAPLSGAEIGALVGEWSWGTVSILPNFAASTGAAAVIGNPDGVPSVVPAVATLAAAGLGAGSLADSTLYDGNWLWGAIWSSPVQDVSRPRLIWRPY